MKKITLLAAVGLSMSLLTGCAAIKDVVTYKTGNQITPEVMNSFNDGTTTKSQVVTAVGHPDAKEMLGELEVWRYHYTQIGGLPGIEDISEASVFEFKDGVLSSHYKTNAPSQDPLSKAAGLTK